MTNSERVHWLAFFCCLSLCIHVGIGLKSRTFGMPQPPDKPTEIEVTLEPLPEEPKAETKPEQKLPLPVAKAQLSASRHRNARVLARGRPFAPKPAVAEPQADGEPAANPIIKTNEPRPTAPNVEPGGTDPTKEEKPLPLGLPNGQKNLTARIRPTLDQATPNADSPRASESASAEPLPGATLTGRPGVPSAAPKMRGVVGGSLLTVENPLAGVGAPANEKPSIPGSSNGGGPRLQRNNSAGGGSPSPGPVPGGRDGFKGPQAPPEDVIFNGGGAGGMNLPKAAPRIGGGGGRSILSVENPLAKKAIPEDKPGLGPGRGGGEGAGAGGGVGYGRGKGIGTDPNGKYALSTLRRKPGSGIGAGTGTGIGTNPPGGGRGTGAELPGTGGSGLGYGRGSGIGSGAAVGGGAGGNGAGGGPGGVRGSLGSGNGGSGGSGRGGVGRGIPFGDITGMLLGDPTGGGGRGGGPGGPGRGAVFGSKPGGLKVGANTPIHIVYLLDVSGSMAQGNKIGKAQDALKKALGELKPFDTFNIVTFYGRVQKLAGEMVPATADNIQTGMLYVDAIRLGGGTNLSGAVEMGFAIDGITHMFVLSDGEPNVGIRDFTQLRQFVRDKNSSHKVQVNALALGLGEQFIGITLLRGIAEDNDGKFSYVNLAKQ